MPGIRREHAAVRKETTFLQQVLFDGQEAVEARLQLERLDAANG